MGAEDESELVKQVAADNIREKGPRALEYLTEQAEVAEANGDRASAKAWREIAAAAARILQC